jgi:hypothetical protein
MPASSVAATCGDSQADDSELWEEVALQQQLWEEVALATPEPARVEMAAQVHSSVTQPKARPSPHPPLGTDSDLPSSEDDEEPDEEPESKRLRFTYPPVWQVGIDWTGPSVSNACLPYLRIFHQIFCKNKKERINKHSTYE